MRDLNIGLESNRIIAVVSAANREFTDDLIGNYSRLYLSRL